MLVVKAVNPQDRPVSVHLEVKGAFSPKTASMRMVAPGSLDARNTLDEPTAVKPEVGVVQLTGKRLAFEMPPYSTAVVRAN